MCEKLFINYLNLLWNNVYQNTNFHKCSQVRFSKELGRLQILQEMYSLCTDDELSRNKKILFLVLVELYDKRFSKSKCKGE